MNRRKINRLVEKQLISFFGLLFLAILLACNPQRKIFKEPIKEKGADYLFDQLKKHELKFITFSAKFSTELLVDKNKTSFSGTIRIKKDSLIWISISPALGIEVVRVLITSDTVKLLDRIKNEYFIGDFKFINKLFNADLDFDMLQTLIIGNDFSYYENDQFKASIDNRHYKLTTVNRHKLKKHVQGNENQKVLVQDIWLEPDSFKISKVLIKQIKENQKLETNYSDFQLTSGGLCPNHVKLDVNADKKILRIDIDFNKININNGVEFPFTIPQKYTRFYPNEK